METKIYNHIDIDFHDSKYISVNAKQYDRKSRYILVTCHNCGEFIRFDNVKHYAFIRYRKSDDLGVFNSCVITDDGNILVELSEQMLASVGKSCADLVVVESSVANISDNGEISINEEDGILSTMTFYVNVIQTAIDNVEIESSYEYNALNDLLIKATEDYTYVITMCRDFAESAKSSENHAKLSEENAKNSEDNAKESENKTSAYADMVTKKASEAVSAAKTSTENAEITIQKAEEAENSAISAKSYTVGGTGSRNGENMDNTKYYYEQTVAITNSLSGKFSPMGTISFSELETVTKGDGYVYHIRDAFTTDATFKGGAGVSYPAGTNVYYTVDGYWDCFVGKLETVEALSKTIEELEQRIKALEEQTVLSIKE